MKTFQLYLTQLALASGILAVQYEPATGAGSGSGVPGTPDWRNLNLNSKASKSERLTSGWGIGTEAPNGESPMQTLTWRINITEAAVPDASNSSGPIPNARMLNTVYDLSWQGDENLQDTMSAIQKAAQPSRNNDTKPPQLCATIFTALFPANVTNAYNTSSQDNCSGALRACLLPLLASTGNVGGSGCPTLKDPSTIPACDGVFENSGSPATLDLTQAGNGGVNASFPLFSGNAFFFESSEAYEQGNSTFFYQQDLKLHVMILDTVGSTTRAVCSRVNYEGEARDESTGAAEQMGVAVKGSRVSVWTVGVAVLGPLAFVL